MKTLKDKSYVDGGNGLCYSEEDLKQAIKELKDWLTLHQDTLITGGTVWTVIEDKFGVWE